MESVTVPFSTQGNGYAQFYFPSGIGVDSSNNIYVADSENERIQKFAPRPVTIFEMIVNSINE